MEIKSTVNAMLNVASTNGVYTISGNAEVIETGQVTSVQVGSVKMSDEQIATFTSWNADHLNFDCKMTDLMLDCIEVIKDFLAEVRSQHFSVQAKIES